MDEVDLDNDGSTAKPSRRTRAPKPAPVEQAPAEPRHVTGLNSEDRELFERYVEHCAENLGLADWIIDVAWNEPADPDCTAEIAVVEGRHAAVLHPGRDMDQLSRDDLARTVIHELLHCHMAAGKHVLLAGVKDHVAPGVAASLERQASLMEEYVVDALSVALTAWLPGPTWHPVVPVAAA